MEKPKKTPNELVAERRIDLQTKKRQMIHCSDVAFYQPSSNDKGFLSNSVVIKNENEKNAMVLIGKERAIVMDNYNPMNKEGFDGRLNIPGSGKGINFMVDIKNGLKKSGVGNGFEWADSSEYTTIGELQKFRAHYRKRLEEKRKVERITADIERFHKSWAREN